MRIKALVAALLLLTIAMPAQVSAHACVEIWMGPPCGPCDPGTGLDNVVHYHAKAQNGILNYDCVSINPGQQEQSSTSMGLALFWQVSPFSNLNLLW